MVVMCNWDRRLLGFGEWLDALDARTEITVLGKRFEIAYQYQN